MRLAVRTCDPLPSHRWAPASVMQSSLVAALLCCSAGCVQQGGAAGAAQDRGQGGAQQLRNLDDLFNNVLVDPAANLTDLARHFVDGARAAELLAELRSLRLAPAAAATHTTTVPGGARVTFQKPSVVSSSSCTKRTMANAAFMRGNITTLFIGQGLDGYPCPPIKAVPSHSGVQVPTCVAETLANCSSLWRTAVRAVYGLCISNGFMHDDG